MKVIDSRKKENIIEFIHLNRGATFKLPSSNEVYIKINDLYDFYGEVIEKNAVCLNTGIAIKFYTGEKIIPLNCECIIKDKEGDNNGNS